jgi:hypothetical protein
MARIDIFPVIAYITVKLAPVFGITSFFQLRSRRPQSQAIFSSSPTAWLLSAPSTGSFPFAIRPLFLERSGRLDTCLYLHAGGRADNSRQPSGAA